MNGDRNDGRTVESTRWHGEIFTPVVNAFISEIQQLGGEAELTRTFAQFRKELEPALQQIRDRLMAVAMDRGLET
jgi:hypothetical protein